MGFGLLGKKQPQEASEENGTDLSSSPLPRASAPNLLIVNNILALLRRMAFLANARLGGRPRLGEQRKGFEGKPVSETVVGNRGQTEWH